MAEAAGPAVLLADDEPMLLRLMQRVLEAEGFRVLPAADGDAALAVFAAEPAAIGVAVLDVLLPPDGATVLLRRILDLAPDVGVVFTSGLPLEPAVEAVLSRQKGAFLQKPFAPEALQRAVAERLRDRAG